MSTVAKFAALPVTSPPPSTVFESLSEFAAGGDNFVPDPEICFSIASRPSGVALPWERKTIRVSHAIRWRSARDCRWRALHQPDFLMSRDERLEQRTSWSPRT